MAKKIAVYGTYEVKIPVRQSMHASWKENVKVVAWVSLLSHNLKLLKWFVMQCIKEGSTLRISPKRNKTSPRVVFRYGKQDKEIKNFFTYRKLIKRITRLLASL